MWESACDLNTRFVLIVGSRLFLSNRFIRCPEEERDDSVVVGSSTTYLYVYSRIIIVIIMFNTGGRYTYVCKPYYIYRRRSLGISCYFFAMCIFMLLGWQIY